MRHLVVAVAEALVVTRRPWHRGRVPAAGPSAWTKRAWRVFRSGPDLGGVAGDVLEGLPDTGDEGQPAMVAVVDEEEPLRAWAGAPGSGGDGRGNSGLGREDFPDGHVGRAR
jgi:hypothetical protein